MLASAYLVGAVPTAYLAGRFAKDIDIRRYGSGNVGASNAGRHLGRRYFVLVVIFDFAVKGACMALLPRALGLGIEAQAVAGLLAAAGHNWSPYIGFSGGRGLAVTTGALLALSWQMCAVSVALGTVFGKAFHQMGLWSGIAVALLPLWAWVFGEPPAMLWYSLATIAMTALKRLLSNPGTAAPGLTWRQKALPRLLFDRDTWEAGDWVSRAPEDIPPPDGPKEG